MLLMAGLVCDGGMVPHFRRWQHDPSKRQPAPYRTRLSIRPGTRGTLRISAYGHTLVRCLLYATSQSWSMVLRIVAWRTMTCAGISTGTFKWGWNQVGQIHVRVGRRARGPALGSMSCFAWCNAGMALRCPRSAHASGAFTAWRGGRPPFSVTVYLYEVKKDWNPGAEVLRDNTSPPQVGEVWWNDRAYQQKRWGLPGVGFASDTHPEADVAVMPLAEARYQPGD